MTANLPPAFTARLKKIIPPKKFNEVIKSFSQRKPTTFRVNTLKLSADELQEKLENRGFIVSRLNWYREAFVFRDSQKKLTETELYKQGCFYIQSLSSMIPPLLLAPKKGDKILDITAAPGSKTTQMAAMMGDSGEIVANDLSQIRLLRLKNNLKIQGVTSVSVKQADARSFWQEYQEYFDKSLADVPCSLEGTFYLHEPKSFANWSLKKIEELTNRSRWILRSTLSSTRVGGRIVYSTCTLAPEENEEVIDWILTKEKGKVEIEDFQIPGLDTYPALTGWEGKEYDRQVRKTFRILPSELMEGFYVAVLRKTKSNIIRP
ncbi:hypothetical protein A3J20_00490 [Candidatus Gottesmanbacteria bacterium RIFCSPLOWO2_02_FULL_42_29]|uniref:SAM-dependent MTase RsmB/NOP-type domain-containing protein n=2 Tax=Candidatus Gottesmaniibacteriota TaxID=1752720 RepID=A0A1F6BBA5_9BACT|nr:MAG: RNA methylase, NOL1/NOP2/sun family [Candidatus Gottesmanbacteria bacterium GW2011_GWA2_42_18]KKS74631.1 MAG: RNA methylase, NOL1/NOP2/sun family [Candidatus Gottesmanbacteria bacterium GW2011_GWC2_42_8]OGG09638.1 MAG: hypothetical protein A2781_02780 [Candidatus Gottesmanbacteria bacterium RIFCSPHIGHO2_01_FULL_42_27]OGG19584.1 MAG: hypothetical protein A3E72_05655 [Candidatus Gottesmanbacteria bacterium RIFCSPHIGHO2_12_FULL_43_26]OGG33804.1 MAG: hypothetical protein A3G68_04195 [Candid